MRIKFWGVRGSIPSPGPRTVRFGGNTTCSEVAIDGQPPIVIDAGTGIRDLGYRLGDTHRPEPVRIFITHTHWDHIQGFPFFSPFYIRDFPVAIFGPANRTNPPDSIRDVLELQFRDDFFPVNPEQLLARIAYCNLRPGPIDLGGVKVVAHPMNHTVLAFGYRVEHGGKSVVVTGDREPFDQGEGARAADPRRKELAAFCSGADILVTDAQFTVEEYAGHVGWGHSHHDDALALAREAGVRQLVCTHHDPRRTDSELDALEESLQRRASGDPFSVRMAREGMVCDA